MAKGDKKAKKGKDRIKVPKRIVVLEEKSGPSRIEREYSSFVAVR